MGKVLTVAGDRNLESKNINDQVGLKLAAAIGSYVPVAVTIMTSALPML